MTERDDFFEVTKRFVAFRASHHCSFPGCAQSTVGPSDESPTAVTNIGVAAHICAASPGGKRYVVSMSREERCHIDNAIWLCSNHAALIDRDDVTYTIECLRAMKRTHEAACAENVRRGERNSASTYDLIAIGPDIICTGELLGVEASEWSFRLNHFVVGTLGDLIGFIERFSGCPRNDRYLLVNALGDGRVVVEAPAFAKSETGLLVRCRVAPSAPRIKAQQIGRQWAISSSTGDLLLENGQIAEVSGLAALPQNVRSCLSMQRGESPFHPDYGVRLAQFFDGFRDSPWLKLEVIRQSAIPYHDEVLSQQYTPLQCVERVRNLEVLGEAENERLPIRVDFDVHGVGRWQNDLSICLPSAATLKKLQSRQELFAALQPWGKPGAVLLNAMETLWSTDKRVG
jgi:hypothetical protein